MRISIYSSVIHKSVCMRTSTLCHVCALGVSKPSQYKQAVTIQAGIAPRVCTIIVLSLQYCNPYEKKYSDSLIVVQFSTYFKADVWANMYD